MAWAGRYGSTGIPDATMVLNARNIVNINVFVELVQTPTPVVQLLVLGVMYGFLYGVLALGLTLVWGVMKVVNVAHGDFVIVGAYASYWAFTLGGLSPVESLLVTLP